MRVVGVVPCRRGSTRLPGKNFKPFADGPSLTERAVLCAQQSGVCAEIVISSDALDVEALAKRLGVCWHHRSPHAASSTATAQDALRDLWPFVAEYTRPDLVLWLQPTSPLRTPGLLQRVVGLLEGGAPSVVTVQPLGISAEEVLCLGEGALSPVWNEDLDAWYPPADPALRHPTYRRDGLCYGCLASVAAHGTLFEYPVLPLIANAADAISIDTLDDWEEAERRIRKREARDEWQPAYTEGDSARFESCLSTWRMRWP